MNNDIRIPYNDLTIADNQLLTWQGEPFTGTAYEINDTGRMISEATFVEGLQEGITREWFDSGKLRSESHYNQGSKDGTSKSWYENGQIEVETEYAYSIKVRENIWSRNGMLIQNWALPVDDEQRALIDLLAKRFGP